METDIGTNSLNSWVNILPSTLNPSFKRVNQEPYHFLLYSVMFIQCIQMTTNILILKHSNEISILSLNSFLDYVQSHTEEAEREKAHISELVLWPTYPACWGSLTEENLTSGSDLWHVSAYRKSLFFSSYFLSPLFFSTFTTTEQACLLWHVS